MSPWCSMNNSQARLFPVLTHQQDQERTATAIPAAAAAGVVMWMQDVQEHASAAPASSAPAAGPPISEEGGGNGNGDASNGHKKSAAAAWLAAERLSFKEILARADPGAEFKWRRQLEEGMVEASGGGALLR